MTRAWFTASELHRILEPFLLRRVKAEVAADLPKKTELVVFHGMSALQKKYYKAILMKDLGERLLPTSALFSSLVGVCGFIMHNVCESE